MVAAVTSPEDLINNTLARIGFKRRLGSIWDGSDVAKKALDLYAQTRDELLRTQDFGFARRDVGMTLLKQAPQAGYVPGVTNWDPTTNPPPPWGYEYAYPSDCLRVRAVKPVPMFVPSFDVRPYVFAVDNDNAVPSAPVKVILCNVAPPAILTYTGQITNPAEWEADFVEVFATALGRRLAPLFGSDGLETVKMVAADEAQADAAADTTQG